MRNEQPGLVARATLRATGANVHQITTVIHCYRLWLELAKQGSDDEITKALDECERVMHKFAKTGVLDDSCHPPPPAA